MAYYPGNRPARAWCFGSLSLSSLSGLGSSNFVLSFVKQQSFIFFGFLVAGEEIESAWLLLHSVSNLVLHWYILPDPFGKSYLTCSPVKSRDDPSKLYSNSIKVTTRMIW